MDLGISGRWALVCGASKGLGFGCARALALEGVNLVMVARTEANLLQARERILAELEASIIQRKPSAAGSVDLPKLLCVAADIATEQGRAAVFAVRNVFDIVVTNAAGPPTGDFRQFSRDDWLAAIDANMLAPIELMRTTIDAMATRQFGRVINITSGAVKAPIDILGLSSGARAGLTGFVAGLARSDLAARGVTINNVLPGIFDTDRLTANLSAMATRQGTTVEAMRVSRIAHVPARRMGVPDEFGALCAYLCSQQAGYITGQNIVIDGGAFAGAF